eukprot:CAMPEP_0201531104 /NCGR_PEP_ID=MMETSP0161_2-20130828/46587_1 /ASSEMBLY_ACC=CAM_ASM_000251 /TAXON_ID=180227 /ORGANISM="Neoparamoeba aestuarina, Strain SoJaBio B1-5/56/2" /LENGTH=782 /DNA_ID=CAMNT_0047933789 /DNA_START=6 /DNA_END=2354 /DNA_ORIENTATION=+
MKEELAKSFGFTNFTSYDSSQIEAGWKPRQVSVRKGHYEFLKTMELALEKSELQTIPPMKRHNTPPPSVNIQSSSTSLSSSAASSLLAHPIPSKEKKEKEGKTSDKRKMSSDQRQKRRSTLSKKGSIFDKDWEKEMQKAQEREIEREREMQREREIDLELDREAQEKQKSEAMDRADRERANNVVAQLGMSGFSLKKYLFFDAEIYRDSKIGGRYLLFKRFMALAGITVTDGADKRFTGDRGNIEKGFRFNAKEPLSLLDLDQLEGRVKHMNIVSAAAGTFFQYKGLAEKDFAPVHFREAIDRYEESLERDPHDKTVLFSVAITWYKLLRELRLSKDRNRMEAIFKLDDSGVVRTMEYFLDAIEYDPQNRLALCSFAEFTQQCGLFETAEDYYLRALELDPHFTYALMRYGNFLIQRNIGLVGQMFLEKGGQSAGTDGTIDAVTGEQVGGAVKVDFPDGTSKTVRATPATNSAALMESLQGIFLRAKGKAANPAEIELVQAQFRILVLHEKKEGGKMRPMKDTEKPWLLLQKPGQQSVLAASPLIHPPSAYTAHIDHYLELLDKLLPPDCAFAPPGALAEFENTCEAMKTHFLQHVDPLFRTKQAFSTVKKHLGPPKKQPVEWVAYNMCFLGRIALCVFSFISNFSDGDDMNLSAKDKSLIVPWMRKGHGIKEAMFLPPKHYAKHLKDLLIQMMQTSLNPALKGAIKPKKFLGDMSVLASRVVGLMVHSCAAHQMLIKSGAAWEVPIAPLVVYSFYFCWENGLLDKKTDHDISTGFAELDLE